MAQLEDPVGIAPRSAGQVELARKGLSRTDRSLIDEVKGLGVTVTELTESERAAFVKAVQPTYQKWTKTVGPDLVKQAEAAVAARKA